MIVLRRLLGDVLRARRQRQGRTLREVSATARVSLGYLSEVERGQKEASSELLGAICTALDVPMSAVLREVSDVLVTVESGVPYDPRLMLDSLDLAAPELTAGPAVPTGVPPGVPALPRSREVAGVAA